MADGSGAGPRRGVRELPLMERPRERLVAHGAATLSAPELLSVLWGTGRPGEPAIELASELLARHGGLPELSAADVLELTQLPGLGNARAAQLMAAFELGRRSIAQWPAGRWIVRAPRDVADRLIAQMAHLEREELRVLLLNTKNAVLRQSTVYQGNVSTALVRTAELFRDAVRGHAAGLILIHNHPSGDPEPSPDDLHLTAETIAAGRLLDIAVLDHLIITRGAYVSLRDRGVAFDRPGPWR
jgi:DNA repair protein RadC